MKTADVSKAMAALATLARVRDSLAFLSSVGIVKPEDIAKGCRKFVKDHPEIQMALDAEFSRPQDKKP